jgi:HTH-type transcriptional regulator / antitoxin HigA
MPGVAHSRHDRTDQAPAAHIEFQPDWAVSPGTLIRSEIEARGMTQADLAARAKLTEKHVSQVMTGTVTLTADVALAFERSLGVPAQTLLLAEARHQAARSSQDAFERLAKHERWARKFPLGVLRANGAITGRERGGELVDHVLRFFGVADPAAFEEVSLAGISGFRRAQHLHVNEFATATWLRLGELQTARHRLPSYNSQKLRRCLASLRPLSNRPDGEAYQAARDELAACGVALAFVDGINESRACGATRWVTATRPLIVLSDRYGYRDTLWFSLMHEIGHVLHHPRRRTFVNIPEDGDDGDGLEAQANEFAAEALVPVEYRQRLLALRTPAQFRALAEELAIDVSVVAGQYGHLVDDWAKVSRLRKKLDVAGLEHVARAPLGEVGTDSA